MQRPWAARALLGAGLVAQGAFCPSRSLAECLACLPARLPVGPTGLLACSLLLSNVSRLSGLVGQACHLPSAVTHCQAAATQNCTLDAMQDKLR